MAVQLSDQIEVEVHCVPLSWSVPSSVARLRLAGGEAE